MLLGLGVRSACIEKSGSIGVIPLSSIRVERFPCAARAWRFALRYACRVVSGSAAALRFALAAALLSGCGGASRDPRPDLLLVTVDTLRADRLACYGGESDVGHALCRIGERGTHFVWAFSTAPSTAPSTMGCSALQLYRWR